MSEATEETAAAQPSTAIVVKPAREVLITHSNRAIWDSGDFQHMGRIASVMADTGVMPLSFQGTMKGQGDNAVLEPFERSQVVANALMLCSMAREMDANPFLFMQCASLVRGRIMLEGKVIAAAIEHRTGIRLRYEFGLWDTDHFLAVEDPTELHGAAERLAVRVSGQFPDEDAPRTVEGSVGQWTTGAKGAWSKMADWPRQLRYRGARERGRAHAPGVTLGIYGDGDEFEDDPVVEGPKPRVKRDLPAKLNGKGSETPQEGAQGFDRAGVAEALGDAAGGAPAASGEVVECEHEFEGDGDDRACKHCGQLEADARPTTQEADTGTGGVQSAEAGQDTSGSADDASEATTAPDAIDGPAPHGEQYFLFGDAIGADGRRLTYMNGARFSSSKNLAKFKVYTEHAAETVTMPEPETQADEEDGLDQPCELCGAAAGEDCKDDCPGLETETAAISTGDERVDAAQAEPEPETGFLATLRPMKSWPDEFKPALAAMFKTSDWMTADEADKNEMRRAIWGIVIASGAKVDQADDPSAFGLWLASQGESHDDADAVEGTFQVLQRGDRWAKMTPAARKPLEDRMAAKLKSIRGK